MDNNTAIIVDNVSKSYRLYKKHADRVKETLSPFRKKYHRRFNALSNISFDVKDGESLGIIGRNGSGKSTLLQIISGVLNPTEGSVTVNGKTSALLELGAGFNPEFTGRENVYLNASILGFTDAEISKRTDDILDFAGIGEFFDQPLKTYSSGMKIRLAFSLMAHMDSDILIVDEALAVGDVYFVQKCMRWIKAFQTTGVLLLVTHNLVALRNLCDRAIWLDNGKMIQEGSPKAVGDAYLEFCLKDHQDDITGKDSPGDSQYEIESVRSMDKIPRQPKKFVDQRVKFLNHTQYRNDIKIFQFDPARSSFGKGGAKIIDVELRDSESDKPLSFVVGGELVKLVIKCRAESSLFQPIVGFFCTNSQGQELFVDNTYLLYRDKGLTFEKGDVFCGTFEFQMPLLPAGDYSISTQIAEGTQTEHVFHHWYHESLIFRSMYSATSLSIIGIPMIDVNIKKM